MIRNRKSAMIPTETSNEPLMAAEERDAAVRADALEDLLLDFEGWKHHGEFKEFGPSEMRSDEEFVRYRYLAAKDYLERLQDELYEEEDE